MTDPVAGQAAVDESEARAMLRATAERVAQERFGGHAVEWDREGQPLPDAERTFLGELGFLGIALPTECGGGGAPLMDALTVIEELAKVSPAAAFPVFESNTGPARVIDLLGTEEQRRRWLPPIARGEATMGVSISEPDAGSAATDLTTRAVLDGDEYVIEGTKRWCSGAGHAELYLVYVRLTDEPGARGVGAVVVERDVEGLHFGPRERLMGFRSVPSADMTFDGVRVPADNLVVEAGGFRSLFRAFSIERLGNATMSLAIAQTALDRTAAYVQERRQFGKELVEFQLVQARLADMVVRVEAARELIRKAAEPAGRGAPEALDASIAKLFANETAKEVASAALELHGGYGYSEEYEVERLVRDAHGWAIAGGAGNIQRVRIASEFLGRRFDQRR